MIEPKVYIWQDRVCYVSLTKHEEILKNVTQGLLNEIAELKKEKEVVHNLKPPKISLGLLTHGSQFKFSSSDTKVYTKVKSKGRLSGLLNPGLTLYKDAKDVIGYAADTYNVIPL